MCFAESGIDGRGSLIAISKGAAIGKAGKWAGDEFGIIGIGDAREETIFFADVVIAAHIELIDVVTQHGVGGVIVEERRAVGRGVEVEKFDGVGIKAGGRGEIFPAKGSRT